MASFGSRPGGLSISITSAPKSARMRVQVGPARTRVRSSTRIGARAVDGVGRGMRLSLRFDRTLGETYFRHGRPPARRSHPCRGAAERLRSPPPVSGIVACASLPFLKKPLKPFLVPVYVASHTKLDHWMDRTAKFRVLKVFSVKLPDLGQIEANHASHRHTLAGLVCAAAAFAAPAAAYEIDPLTRQPI